MSQQRSRSSSQNSLEFKKQTEECHAEIVQLRKELNEFSSHQKNMFELCEDELRQAKAAQLRTTNLQLKKSVSNNDDRMEHVQSQHHEFEREQQQNKWDQHRDHLSKEDKAAERRAAILAERIHKARHLENPRLE